MQRDLNPSSPIINQIERKSHDYVPWITLAHITAITFELFHHVKGLATKDIY